MAVTPTVLSQINDLAKDYFTNVYVNTVNTEVPLKMQFARLENAQFTGRKWIFGVKAAVGGGSANGGANTTLPAATQGVYDQGEMQLVRTYTRMALDNFAIEVTRQSAGSFRPALAETMADRLEAHDLEVNRQLFCNGDGVLTKIGTGASSATQNLSNDYGQTTLSAATNGARHVNPGDVVQVYKADRTTKIGGAIAVSSVDQSGQTMTLASSIDTTAAGGPHFVTRATADTDNVVSGEAGGLLASVGTQTFETIDPSTTARWKSSVFGNSGVARDLTDGLVMQAIETIRAKSRKFPNLAVCRGGVVLKYSEQFLPLRRIAGLDVELKGGYKPIAGIQFAGGIIPVLTDPDCPDNRLFLINTESFRMADLVGTSWFDGDGAQFSRVIDKDAIEGFIRKYWNLATIQRNTNGVITDLNDIAGIDRVAA